MAIGLFLAPATMAHQSVQAAAAPAASGRACPVLRWTDRKLDAASSTWSNTMAPETGLSPEAGLRLLPPPRAPFSAHARTVLLVHGLDDTGKTFDTLIETLLPARDAAGRAIAVAVFEYPNDQPIAASAALLAECLAGLDLAPGARVDVVAHSMGGLVVLDAMDRAAVLNGSRLITIGTPYAGAPLAKVRAISEAREQWIRWRRDSDAPLTALVGGLADGAGEAGRDLLPGSDFLAALDLSSPRPVELTVVVGRPMGSFERPASAPIAWWKPTAWWRWSRQLWASSLGLVGDGAVPDWSARACPTDDVVTIADWHGRLAHHPETQSLVLDRLGLTTDPEPGSVAILLP